MDSPAGDGEKSWREAVASSFALGRAAHPAMRVDLGAWQAEVLRRLDARIASASLAPTTSRRTEWLARAAQADLYLAVACGLSAKGAWERLTADLSPRLAALARERGVRGADAEALASDVLSDLWLPASGRDPRPLLSTYAGTGSLFGFASVLLARRVTRRLRDPRVRKRVAMTSGTEERSDPRTRAGAPGPTPAEGAERAELTHTFDAALEQAAAALTPRERLVLVMKHRDGLPQRAIAAALGVGEPRVSHLLASAVERLRAGLRGRAGGLPAEALRDVLAARLARAGGVAAPPGGGRRSEEPT